MQGVWEGKGIIEDRALDSAERVFEFFLNQLRLREGVLKDQLEPRTGIAWNEVSARVSEAIEKGLLKDENGVLAPTGLGWRFSNEIQAIFLP
jgi:oxygen-independent coproporphyrinogen-3 oxidase